jgi:hypothetical protein
MCIPVREPHAALLLEHGRMRLPYIKGACNAPPRREPPRREAAASPHSRLLK